MLFKTTSVGSRAGVMAAAASHALQSSWFQAIMVDDSAAVITGSSSSSTTTTTAAAIPPSFGLHIVRGRDSLTRPPPALHSMSKGELLQLLQPYEFPVAAPLHSSTLEPLCGRVCVVLTEGEGGLQQQLDEVLRHGLYRVSVCVCVFVCVCVCMRVCVCVCVCIYACDIYMRVCA